MELPDREKPDALVNVLKAERPDQAIVFVRTKIGVEPPRPPARRRGRAREDAARRHDPGPARRRDDRIPGRSRAPARGHRRGGARTGHPGVGHLRPRHAELARHLCPPHRCTGRAGESGRAITLISPKQRREIDAIERHAKTEIEPWKAGNGKAPAREAEARAARARDPRARGTPSRTAATACPTPSWWSTPAAPADRARRRGGRGGGPHASRERRRPQRARARALQLRWRCRPRARMRWPAR